MGVTMGHPPTHAMVSYQKQMTPEALFQALGINTPSQVTEWGCWIIPLYIRKVPSLPTGYSSFNTYYLADIATKMRRAVRVIPLSHDGTIDKWSVDQAKDQILDQTAEALRAVMLHEHKYNPLKYWNDAIWFYAWNSDYSGCLLLPYVEIE